MKLKIPILIAAIALLLTLNPQLSTCFAQGSLTPPGPPGPTMLSLSQVQPRIPIPGGNSTFFIGQPGSYYLTSDIIITNDSTAGLYIDASNVTVDLEGYSIIGTKALPQNTVGIGANFVSPPSNLTIRNGRIAGFLIGIESGENNTTIENMELSNIGMWAIIIGGSNTNRFVTNIHDNTIDDVDLNQAGNPNNRGEGILLEGASGVIEHNSINGVFGLTGSESLVGVGIEIDSSSDGFVEVVNNRVANAYAGFYFLSGTIAYRDNISMEVTTHYYTGTTTTNLGNNY